VHDEPLFDISDYRRQKEPDAPAGELAEATALDRETTLVPGNDNLLARKVALHSLDKAHYAHYYADIVGTGMKTAYGGPLAWIELFCGPGRLWVKELQTFRPGSPIETLSIRHPFDYHVFADLDPRCTEALRARIAVAVPDRPNVRVLDGDANSAQLHDRIASIVPKNALTVLYADQAGINLHFDTIRFFADRYKHLDLLLNYPVAGVVRALRAGYEEKASKFLDHDAPSELIGPTSGRPGTSLRDWFAGRLAELGYEHFAAEVVKMHTRNVPLYDLMLASRERRAVEFFHEAVKRGPGGQYALDFGS
jgi:three-Cys-motif partner protein